MTIQSTNIQKINEEEFVFKLNDIFKGDKGRDLTNQEITAIQRMWREDYAKKYDPIYSFLSEFWGLDDYTIRYHIENQ